MLMQSKDQLRRHLETGFSMIEVLITIVIIAVGLLGLSGLQAKTTVMEMEAYERAQALALLQDLEDRIRASRGSLVGPLTPVATGGAAVTTIIGPNGTAGYNPANAAACASFVGSELQICEWALSLNGAAEKVAGSKVGAMLGARACIISVVPSQLNALAEYYLVVVWQGLVPTSDPVSGSMAANCASTVAVFGTGLRRAAMTRVLIPKLAA